MALGPWSLVLELRRVRGASPHRRPARSADDPLIDALRDWQRKSDSRDPDHGQRAALGLDDRQPSYCAERASGTGPRCHPSYAQPQRPSASMATG
jgi:hypothetical protein